VALICYHASHEQFAPSHLLKLVQQAEQAGFAAIHSSDHFHPWSAGSWADGLLTTAGQRAETQEKITAFKENGGAGKPVYVQFAFSYARSREEAVAGAWHQWRSNMIPADAMGGLYKPEHFDAAG